MPGKKFRYKSAVERIEEIITIIKSQEPGVDELTGLVKEAATLLESCKKMLKTAENDLNNALNQLD